MAAVFFFLQRTIGCSTSARACLLAALAPISVAGGHDRCLSERSACQAQSKQALNAMYLLKDVCDEACQAQSKQALNAMYLLKDVCDEGYPFMACLQECCCTTKIAYSSVTCDDVQQME